MVIIMTAMIIISQKINIKTSNDNHHGAHQCHSSHVRRVGVKNWQMCQLDRSVLQAGYCTFLMKKMKQEEEEEEEGEEEEEDNKEELSE